MHWSVHSRTTPSIDCLTDPTPYIQVPGTAREALTFYGEVLGCLRTWFARLADGGNIVDDLV